MRRGAVLVLPDISGSSSSLLAIFDFVEHGFGGDILFNSLDFLVDFGFDAEPVGDRGHHCNELGNLVLGARELICGIELGPLSAVAVIRFCVIRIKVDKKIASTEATIARMTKDGSNLGTHGIAPRLMMIHPPKIMICR